MIWFMLAMIAYPEKQRKCQEELERVVGRSRMPTFEDQPSLPYTRAVVREILRWRTVAPVGEPCPRLDSHRAKDFPHRTHAQYTSGTVRCPDTMCPSDNLGVG